MNYKMRVLRFTSRTRDLNRSDYIWAATWQNQQSDCVPNEDSDQPGHPVWSESSLCAQWVAKDPSFLHADSKDSDQIGWMLRLIWVFTGRTVILLVLSCPDSYAHAWTANNIFTGYYHVCEVMFPNRMAISRNSLIHERHVHRVMSEFQKNCLFPQNLIDMKKRGFF